MSDTVDPFITRWQAAGGSERANYQLFLTELAALLDLPRPDPAAEDTRDNAYAFERRVQFRQGDGSDSSGYIIDLYRRGCFVLEAKKIKLNAVKGFDEALLRAKPGRRVRARASYRERWWVFAEPRSEFRTAVTGLRRFLVTPMTAKHRLFLFLDANARCVWGWGPPHQTADDDPGKAFFPRRRAGELTQRVATQSLQDDPVGTRPVLARLHGVS